MSYEKIEVECYSGYKANERPVAFTYQKLRREVVEIVDRWYEGGLEAQNPDVNYFKIRTVEGEVFLLRYVSLFAEALSGFANSDGGIIVWGIEARKNSQGIDYAFGKKLIMPLSLLISNLNKYTGEAVNPDIEGVQHSRILCSDDTGYVVTLVPASDARPPSELHVLQPLSSQYRCKS